MFVVGHLLSVSSRIRAVIGYAYSPSVLEYSPPPMTADVGGVTLELGTMNVSNPLLTKLAHEVCERSDLLGEVLMLDPKPAPGEVLLEVHDNGYIERLKEASLHGGPWTADFAPVTPLTWSAATIAAGGAVAAVDAVINGPADRAISQMRPPGHHAERNVAMGSCYLNNVACAAVRARALGAERVMIVDWDVHIGNGAERIFWDRDDVLAMSIHQYSWYPEGAGLLDSTGGSKAVSATVNVPLPPAVTNAGYLWVITDLVGPIARRYHPDLIIVAAGQDPSIFDPMGRMLVSATGFGAMTEWVGEIAEEVCEGRMVVCMEGGYNHLYSPFCAAAIVGALTGRVPELVDPFEGDVELRLAMEPPGKEVGEAIDAVRMAHPRWFE